MSRETLHSFVQSNKSVLKVAGSTDALYLCCYIARYGYVQTLELKEEFQDESGRLGQLLKLLITAGLVAHRVRPGGIFNGWVVSQGGLKLLKALDLFELVTSVMMSRNIRRSFSTRPWTLTKAGGKAIPTRLRYWASWRSFLRIGRSGLALPFAMSR
jgi:hypothetical protein